MEILTSAQSIYYAHPPEFFFILESSQTYFIMLQQHHVSFLSSFLLFFSLALPTRAAVSDSGQTRREKFRQQKQKEMEVDVLQNIMKFVEDFLRTPSIWVFDNKEQNLLIYEVREKKGRERTELIRVRRKVWLDLAFI